MLFDNKDMLKRVIHSVHTDFWILFAVEAKVLVPNLVSGKKAPSCGYFPEGFLDIINCLEVCFLSVHICEKVSVLFACLFFE